jgi:hypothetical protein
VDSKYSSTLSLTSALDGVGGQRHTLAALPPGKTRYPLYRRLGGAQGQSGRVREILPPPGFDPRNDNSDNIGVIMMMMILNQTLPQTPQQLSQI